MLNLNPPKDTFPLVINGLSVVYGQKPPAVNNVDFRVPAGKVTALVGANGCGKSTLLKAIARILPSTAGQITLNDQPLTNLSTRDIAKQLAILPQGPVAPQGLTVHELVSQGRFPHQHWLRRWSADDSRAVEQAMHEADVTGFANRQVASLSGGQRQRCWLAMVLAQQTDIILLDEPTTFLDLKVQIDVMTLLTRISQQQGRTILVVLHELNLAAAFANHMVMMKNGQLICSGSPTDIMTADNIKNIFDLNAHVIHDPHSGAPICVPLVDA